MARWLWSALSMLIVTAVAASCASSGSASRQVRREIDVILDSAFADTSDRSLSRLDRFLDEEITLGLPDETIVAVPREFVLQYLRSYVNEVGEPASPPSAPASDSSVGLAFLQRHHRSEGTDKARVRGRLYLRGAILDAELSLRRRPKGDWTINGFSLLSQPLLRAPLGRPLASEWSGSWQTQPGGRRGPISVSFAPTSHWRLAGHVAVEGHACYTGAEIVGVYDGTLITWSTTGDALFSVLHYDDSSMSGVYAFARCHDAGYFQLTKK